MRLTSLLGIVLVGFFLSACSTRTPIAVATATGISTGYAVTTVYTGTIYTGESIAPLCTGSFTGAWGSPVVTVQLGCKRHYGGIGTGIVRDGRLVAATVRMLDGTEARLRVNPGP